IIARLVDFTDRMRGPDTAFELVARALRSMGTGRPGPAALECAIDVWGRTGSVIPVLPAPAPDVAIDEDALVAAAKRLGAGQRAEDHVRRWGTGGGGRNHRASDDAAGAGLGLSGRPRFARQPCPTERHASAGPRVVGTGRRGAGGRHPPVDAAAAMGHRRKS